MNLYLFAAIVAAAMAWLWVDEVLFSWWLRRKTRQRIDKLNSFYGL